SFHSPTNQLPARRITPPQTNCIPAKAIADTPVARRCPTREPAAHDKADPSNSRTIAGSTQFASGETRRDAMRATPARPGTSPNRSASSAGRSAGATKWSNKTQNGTVAIITAVRPEGTYCCAYAREPWQPTNSKRPPTLAGSQAPAAGNVP